MRSQVVPPTPAKSSAKQFSAVDALVPGSAVAPGANDDTLKVGGATRKTPKSAWATLRATKLKVNGHIPNSPQLSRALVQAAEKFLCKS